MQGQDESGVGSVSVQIILKRWDKKLRSSQVTQDERGRDLHMIRLEVMTAG